MLVDEYVPGEGQVFHALAFVHGHVGDHVGEGLVEPEIVPPLHRDQVTEPLVRNFMRNRIEDVLLPVTSKVLIALNIVVIVRDAADVLHRAHGVVRAHDRVKFVERIRRIKHLLIVPDGSLSDSEPIVLHQLSVARE